MKRPMQMKVSTVLALAAAGAFVIAGGNGFGAVMVGFAVVTLLLRPKAAH